MGATKISSSSNPIGESNTVELTGKIMVVAIIFLFMVVMFVLLLHIYAKWFWWRFEENTAPPPRSRRRRRRFVFAPGQDPVSYSFHQIGLDPLVLKSLPILDFQLEDFKDGLECAVCLSEIVQDEKIRLLPKCNHGFHVDCIDMWFHSHSTCPLCRNPISSEKISSKLGSSSSSSNVEENVSNSESLEEENLTLESSNFPTNVLVWGDQSQVSSFGVSLELEEGSSQSQQPLPYSSSSSSSSSSSNSASDSVSTSRCNGMLVIDIPSEFNSSSLSPSANRCAEHEMKSPMAAKLRSFKRLLSRDKKLISPSSPPSSMDVEQGHS